MLIWRASCPSLEPPRISFHSTRRNNRSTTTCPCLKTLMLTQSCKWTRSRREPQCRQASSSMPEALLSWQKTTSTSGNEPRIEPYTKLSTRLISSRPPTCTSSSTRKETSLKTVSTPRPASTRPDYRQSSSTTTKPWRLVPMKMPESTTSPSARRTMPRSL